MSDIVLQGRGICTSFGSKRERRQVLFDVDVDVYEGECLAIIGASGSGKSTLTRVLFIHKSEKYHFRIYFSS